MSWTVGEVARFAGVTVRTLHHYDEIGLLSPSGRSSSGYRHYEQADLVRLQRVLAYRGLGFSLDSIAAILDDPGVDPVDHLRKQHALLTGQVARLQAMVAAVEKTMEAQKMGVNLTPGEIFEVFGDDDPTRHADEAAERWGDTDAYAESHRRTSRYTKDDWVTIKAETSRISARYADAFRAGLPASSDDAMDAAEEHRASIDRWFYPLSHSAHVGLGETYVADERFTATYDALAPGLAPYVRAAIEANAARHGA